MGTHYEKQFKEVALVNFYKETSLLDFYEEISLLDLYEEIVFDDESQVFKSYNLDYSNSYN